MIENYEKLLEETVEEMMDDFNDQHLDPGDHLVIYTDNPYKVVERNTDQHYYQIIGNEIITITKGTGVCCLCSEVTDILYADNTYNNNIPVQICKPCIDGIMEKK